MKKMFLVLSVVFALMISACTVPQEPAPSVPVAEAVSANSGVIETPPLPPPLPGDIVPSGDLAGQATVRQLISNSGLCTSFSLPVAGFGCTRPLVNVPLQVSNPPNLFGSINLNLRQSLALPDATPNDPYDNTPVYSGDVPAVAVYPEKCLASPGTLNSNVLAGDKCWDNTCTGLGVALPAGSVCVKCSAGSGCPDEANRNDKISVKFSVPPSVPAGTDVVLYKYGYIRSRTLSADRTTTLPAPTVAGTAPGVWVPLEWDSTGFLTTKTANILDTDDWYVISRPAAGVTEVKPKAPAAGQPDPFVLTAANVNFNFAYLDDFPDPADDAIDPTAGDGDNEHRPVEIVYFMCTFTAATEDSQGLWRCNGDIASVSRGLFGLNHVFAYEARLTEVVQGP